MFIELVDVLRCTGAHEETWLVASADRMDGRHIVEGSLGCPICRARFPIRDGAADFRGVAAAPSAGRDLPDEAPPDHGDPATEALRLAALLDLREPAQRALLAGAWAHHADDLLALVPAELLLLDPGPLLRGGAGRSVLHVGVQPLPLAAGAMHAAALDAPISRDPARAASVVRAVRARGRVVGPVGAPVPEGVRELTRDARHWVAEREAPASAPVALQGSRGRRP